MTLFLKITVGVEVQRKTQSLAKVPACWNGTGGRPKKGNRRFVNNMEVPDIGGGIAWKEAARSWNGTDFLLGHRGTSGRIISLYLLPLRSEVLEFWMKMESSMKGLRNTSATKLLSISFKPTVQYSIL
jgi:hypothetical protein